MEDAINVLNEYRDYVIEHREECYWINEESLEEAIEILEEAERGKTVLEIIQKTYKE